MKNHRKFKCIALVLLNLLLLPGAMLHAAMNPPGNALQLNGTSQYVNIPDANSLDLTTNYTLECWFKADSFGSLRSLISKYHTGGANGYLLRLNGTEDPRKNNLDKPVKIA
jgi:hypothetical protein